MQLCHDTVLFNPVKIGKHIKLSNKSLATIGASFIRNRDIFQGLSILFRQQHPGMGWKAGASIMAIIDSGLLSGIVLIHKCL